MDSFSRPSIRTNLSTKRIWRTEGHGSEPQNAESNRSRSRPVDLASLDTAKENWRPSAGLGRFGPGEARANRVTLVDSWYELGSLLQCPSLLFDTLG